MLTELYCSLVFLWWLPALCSPSSEGAVAAAGNRRQTAIKRGRQGAFVSLSKVPEWPMIRRAKLAEWRVKAPEGQVIRRAKPPKGPVIRQSAISIKDALSGVFAEFERDLIRERVNAGLARARDKGVRLGRRPVKAATETRIRELMLRASFIGRASPSKSGGHLTSHGGKNWGPSLSPSRRCSPRSARWLRVLLPTTNGPARSAGNRRRVPHRYQRCQCRQPHHEWLALIAIRWVTPNCDMPPPHTAQPENFSQCNCR